MQEQIDLSRQGKDLAQKEAVAKYGTLIEPGAPMGTEQIKAQTEQAKIAAGSTQFTASGYDRLKGAVVNAQAVQAGINPKIDKEAYTTLIESTARQIIDSLQHKKEQWEERQTHAYA